MEVKWQQDGEKFRDIIQPKWTDVRQKFKIVSASFWMRGACQRTGHHERPLNVVCLYEMNSCRNNLYENREKIQTTSDDRNRKQPKATRAAREAGQWMRSEWERWDPASNIFFFLFSIVRGAFRNCELKRRGSRNGKSRELLEALSFDFVDFKWISVVVFELSTSRLYVNINNQWLLKAAIYVIHNSSGKRRTGVIGPQICRTSSFLGCVYVYKGTFSCKYIRHNHNPN